MTVYGPTPAFEEKKEIRDAGLMLSYLSICKILLVVSGF